MAIISKDGPEMKSIRQALEASEHLWTSNLAPMLREALVCQADDCDEAITPNVLRALAGVLRFAATDLELRDGGNRY